MDKNLPPNDYPFPGTSNSNNASSNPPPANVIDVVDNNDLMLPFDDNIPPNMELPLSIPQHNPSVPPVIKQGQEQEQYGGDDCILTEDMFNYDFHSVPTMSDLMNEPTKNVCGNNYVGESSAATASGQRTNEQENVCKKMKTSVWPVYPQPYVCSGCQLLREIKHVNGKHMRNLVVHGRVGSVYHAFLVKFDFDNISNENREYLMFEFSDDESTDAFKNFLAQYCQQCETEGHTMLPEALSEFYKTLCIGFDENVASDNNTSFPLSMDIMDSVNLNPNQQDYEGDDVRHAGNNGQEIGIESRQGARQERSFLAAQRERTGKMTLEDLSGCFHLPITDAAKIMNVCPTVIKKKCREGGMPRWPHRQIKRIRNKILKKKEELERATFEEKARILAEIQMLEQELAIAIGK